MKVVLGKFYQPIAVAASGVLCKALVSRNIAPFKVVTSALVLHCPKKRFNHVILKFFGLP